MKRIWIVILATVMLLSGCAGGVESDNANGSNVLTEKKGVVCINSEKFSQLLERVELTTENWREYIGKYSFEREIRDDFGELIGTKTICYAGAAPERYHKFEDTIIELKHKESGEMATLNFSWMGGNYYEVYADFDLDAYECTRIKGYLYFFNIPEEAVHSPLPTIEYDWEYKAGFYVVSEHITEPYEVNLTTKWVEKNRKLSDYFEE